MIRKLRLPRSRPGPMSQSHVLVPSRSHVPVPCPGPVLVPCPGHDDNIWWSYMMTIYDDRIWWSYMMIIYDDHIWCSYMMIIYERPRLWPRSQPFCCSWRSTFFVKIWHFWEKHIFRVYLKCNFKAVCKKSLKTCQKYYQETKWTSPSNFWWKNNIYIYIHYRIITKHLLRGCFMISSLSYDNIIMIPKRRFIKKIEIRIFYKSVFGWGSGGGGSFY